LPIAEVCERRARHGCRYANQGRAACVESERVNCRHCCLHSRGRGLAIGRAARSVSSQAPVAVCVPDRLRPPPRSRCAESRCAQGWPVACYRRRCCAADRDRFCCKPRSGRPAGGKQVRRPLHLVGEHQDPWGGWRLRNQIGVYPTTVMLPLTRFCFTLGASCDGSSKRLCAAC